MGVKVWNVVAKQEREMASIKLLWRLRIIRGSASVAFFLTYFRISNAVLKTLMKAHVRSLSLLRKFKSREK